MTKILLLLLVSILLFACSATQEKYYLKEKFECTGSLSNYTSWFCWWTNPAPSPHKTKITD